MSLSLRIGIPKYTLIKESLHLHGAAKEFSHKYENVFQLWKSYMNVEPNTTLTNSSTLSTSPNSQPAADSNSAPTQENVPINTNSSTPGADPGFKEGGFL